VERFLEKHRDQITGTISCFDRLLFKGYLPISWAGSMEAFMAGQGVRIKDFKSFVEKHSARVKAHAQQVAARAGLRIEPLEHSIRKEDKARAIARRNGVTEGLVCVFSAVEACHSFKVVWGKGRPRLINKRRKCLCLYFYFIHRTLGLLHVRIQTWFPFTVQVCLNGHEALAIAMDRAGIAYRRRENAFVWIDKPQRAQRLADRFTRRNWPRTLEALARRVNPLMKDLLGKMKHYWVADQSEYATDVMFKNRESLRPLYEKLLRHATLCFSAEDVLTFLGRKLHGGFKGEVLNDCKKRQPGARVKHRMKKNWMKMYDKHGSVLRIETVINHPYEFKIRRLGKRRGEMVLDWFPMAKRVSNLYRYREVSLAANQRYLEALVVIDDPKQAQKQVRRLAKPARHNGRCWRGFNPADERDAQLFAAVMRGEHHLQGFRNRDIRRQVFPASRDPSVTRRQSATTSRLLKRLHLHGLIAKIPRSRRWRITKNGQMLMSVVLTLHHEHYDQLLTQKAA
jgi:hypothetical protein